MSTAVDLDLTAEQLRIFADPLRLQIIQLLAVEELCTCHLVTETGAKQPTVSHHLRLLREAGMVEAEREGAYTWYRLVPGPIAHVGRSLQTMGHQAGRAVRRRLPCG